MKNLREKKLLKKLSIVQDFASALMAVADIRDVGYRTRDALSRAVLLDKTKHHHSLGDSVLSPDAISSLSSVYHIPKSVTLVVPHAGYDPVEPEEGNLPLPLSTFDQGLRLPLHPFVKKVLSGLEIAPFQLGPLGLQNIISLFVLWMEVAKVFPTLKDFVSFYQGNKSTSTLGQFYLKCNHTAGNPILPGKKPKGDCKMK
ncbi:hypothetical protein LWI29_035323 [Acer saccharum]|uniref:Transposase (putative) gypsy type domain-containing protein n=1 Tax=Acer saccharum TaxID=4024 RepID=A0AA39S2E1_ACESA|nr:hypothetical protein LWI29_035323 [Acer saccharum]